MQISIQSDLRRLSKTIPAAFRRQIPFATSQALNDTAAAIALREGRQDMERDIDRPTRFTKSGLRYTRSNKQNLTSTVYILPNRWEYLKWQINGGRQTARGRAIPIQITNAGLAFFKRNRYGNLARGALVKATARSDTFWGNIKGTYGLWRRVGQGGRGLNLLAVAVPSTEYTQSWDYLGTVQAGVRRHFIKQFTRRMEHAIRTARL